MRKTLSTVFVLLFMLFLLSLVLLSCQSEELESCSETEEATDISDSSDNSQSLFSAEEMSDAEIEIMEKITRRKIGDITENDLRVVKTINIIGSNISLCFILWKNAILFFLPVFSAGVLALFHFI